MTVKVAHLRPALALILAWAAEPALAQGFVAESADALAAAPVAALSRGTLLPARIDLTGLVPPPRSQSSSGTCVSWAVTYGAASAAWRKTSSAGAAAAFSPAFTYALASGSAQCARGTQIIRTLEVLRTIGALPLTDYAFDPFDCAREPTAAERRAAGPWRIRGWGRIDARDPTAVKGHLAQSQPVIFAVNTGRAFGAIHDATVFDTVESGPWLDGHAMLLVGYDDARGAYRLQNSWGSKWGDNGYAWVSTTWFAQATQGGVAFVIE